MTKRSGEYKQKGDYHLKLDKNWPYYPIYILKREWVEKQLSKLNGKIVDLGCGEGVLINQYRKQGYEIEGIDLNYSSKEVKKGDIANLPYKDSSVDVCLLLDVLEHLSFNQQEKALKEVKRVLKKGGTLLIAVPNLAHFASRLTFLFLGKLLRTSGIDRHPGDRPIEEYLKLLNKDFKIIERRGIFPTFPLISFLTLKIPSKVIWLHRIYSRVWPDWCLENLIVCKN